MNTPFLPHSATTSIIAVVVTILVIIGIVFCLCIEVNNKPKHKKLVPSRQQKD